MLFAHLKRILRLGRLRLRGPSGARDEFLLAATAQNLRRLAKLRPPAGPMIAALAPCGRHRPATNASSGPPVPCCRFAGRRVSSRARCQLIDKALRNDFADKDIHAAREFDEVLRVSGVAR